MGSSGATPTVHDRRDMVPLLRRSAVLGALGIGGIALTAGALHIADVRRSEWVRHSREVGRIARHARALATERVAGIRALIIGEDLAPLAPEVAAHRALGPLVDSLAQLSAGNPEQHVRAVAIDSALAAWDRGYGAPVLREVARRMRGEPPLPLPDLTGNTIFDPVRAAFDDFVAAEERLYVQRVERLDRLRWLAIAAILAELVLLAMILAWLARKTFRQAAQLVAQQTQLEDHAVELEVQAAELQEQAVELEEQVQHASATTGELERANEQLVIAMGEARSAERALAAEQHFLRQVIDTIPNFVFAKDREGRFTLVNEAVASAYGTTTAALIGRTDADFNTDAEQVAAFLRDDLTVADTGIPRLIPEESLTDATGAVRWLQTVKRALPNADGSTQVLGVSTDITGRKHAEEALSREREFLSSVLESLVDGLVACDANGVVTIFNRSVRELFGLPSGPLPTERWTDHFTLLETDGVTPLATDRYPLTRAVNGEAVDRTEIVIAPRGQQQRRVLVSARPVVDGQGVKLGAVMAVHDVTERRLLEGQLLQAQKMEAVGRLAGGIAHDFNNMLTAIISYSDLLLQDFDAADGRRDDVEEISKAALRAAALTRQLLVFSRQQVTRPGVVDLNFSVAELEKMLTRLIGADIDVTTRLDPELGKVMADAGQIEQVIMNLVVNARDAMPSGGKLTIETANVVLDEEYALGHAFTHAGAHVMLSVSDTGCGMTREVQERMFEPFYTTKEEGKGTGLGLSTVYGIVRQAGGHVWVYSEVDRGSTFKIYLPRVDAQPAAAVEPTRFAALRPGSETVLLVEDDDAVRGVASRILRKSGYAVIEAFNGTEALRICEDPTISIDVIITDMVMPGLGGREFAGRLQEHRRGVRVIYMSGYTEDAVTRQSLLEPGAAFIEKPFSPDALTRKLRLVLDASPRGRGAE